MKSAPGQLPLWGTLPIARGRVHRKTGRPTLRRLPIECRECHRTFVTDRRNRYSPYCSRRCGKIARRRLTKDKTCANPVCGKSLRGSYKWKFCSKDCSDAFHTKICAYCQQPFICLAVRTEQPCCSKRCARLLKSPPLDTCERCGNPFRARHRGIDRKPRFCSLDCYWGRPRSSPPVVRQPTNYERLRFVIAARDNYLCGICARKINRRLKHPHPRSLSIDHYTPVSKGGDDDPNNLRPAHLICNVRRAAKPRCGILPAVVRRPVDPARDHRQRPPAPAIAAPGLLTLESVFKCLPEPVRAVSKKFLTTPPQIGRAVRTSPDCVRADDRDRTDTQSSVAV